MIGEGEVLDLTVPAAGRRLDAVLAALLEDRGVTRSQVRRWIDGGRVLLNGASPRPSASVRPGDRVAVRVPPAPPAAPPPRDLPFGILYEDEACIVVDKPSGMVTHPARGHYEDTLVNALLASGVALSGVSGPERPGILHRLDKETSGLLVVAKSDAAHALLARQFASRTVRKVYRALAWGDFPDSPVDVDAPVGRDPRNRKRMAVVAGGRPARTLFRGIERFPRISLVEALPQSGRTHQIRVHLASLRHPVVGDRVYGPRRDWGFGDPDLRLLLERPGRFFLHAYRLEFASPAAGRVEVTSPLPPDFEAVLGALRRLEGHDG